MKVTYRGRNGVKYTGTYKTRKEAEARVAELEGFRARTMECAPTSYGDVDFLYDAEMKAIKAVLELV